MILGDNFCWISNGKALLVVLGAPVALILLFNCVAITITLLSIWKVQKVLYQPRKQKISPESTSLMSSSLNVILVNSDLLLYPYSKQGFNLGICAHLKPDEVLICFNTTAYTCQITLGKTMAYKLTVFIYFSFIIYLFLSPFSPHDGWQIKRPAFLSCTSSCHLPWGLHGCWDLLFRSLKSTF